MSAEPMPTMQHHATKEQCLYDGTAQCKWEQQGSLEHAAHGSCLKIHVDLSGPEPSNGQAIATLVEIIRSG